MTNQNITIHDKSAKIDECVVEMTVVSSLRFNKLTICEVTITSICVIKHTNMARDKFFAFQGKAISLGIELDVRRCQALWTFFPFSQCFSVACNVITYQSVDDCRTQDGACNHNVFLVTFFAEIFTKNYTVMFHSYISRLLAHNRL